MDDGDVTNQDVSRREAMKTALKLSAYAAPVILSASVPRPAAAQITGGIGTLTGTITNATNGQPISGATVAIDPVVSRERSFGVALSATTDARGVYSIANVPAGTRVVHVSATGFSSRTDNVAVGAGVTTTYSTALVPISERQHHNRADVGGLPGRP